MSRRDKFGRVLEFFQSKRKDFPGDRDYDAALCHCLVVAASAEAASIWGLDDNEQLQLSYSTDIHDTERVADITILPGEGIGGAVVLSRKAVEFYNATSSLWPDRRVDHRIGFRTRSMISAPILHDEKLYGVLNVLNHASGRAFPRKWKEYLAAAGAMYGAALAKCGRSLETETAKEAKPPAAFMAEPSIVGRSLAVRRALEWCTRVAQSRIPVLIVGETGTGKELAARRIHKDSPRSAGPFIAVNCAGLPETLLDSELFGHVKGAFTGASSNRKGKFLAASGGSLFLDEIAGMSQTCQAKILRVLEERKVTPVGSEKTIDCDPRIIAATNRDLREEVEDGNFREDLYYRLCGVMIEMPPLRERDEEDIELLVTHFIKKALAEYQQRSPSSAKPSLSDQALEMLKRFPWPGNVRQLEQVITTALTICEEDEISVRDLLELLDSSTAKRRKKKTEHRANSGAPARNATHLDEERRRYMEALESTKYHGTGRYNYSAAAALLGIPRKTFTYRVKKFLK